MPFQVIVREIKPNMTLKDSVKAQDLGLNTTQADLMVGNKAEQIYEQTVETLDLGKVIAAVNHRKRERRPRAEKASPATR